MLCIFKRRDFSETMRFAASYTIPFERKPNKKPPIGWFLFGGDGGARTHDLFDVNEAL